MEECGVNICTWNVGSMTGRGREIADVMDRRIDKRCVEGSEVDRAKCESWQGNVRSCIAETHGKKKTEYF